MTNPIQNPLQKLKRNRLLLIALVLLTFVILIWISLSLFTSQTKSKLSSEVMQLTAPLNPAVDRNLLGLIENKRGLTEMELKNFPIYKILTDKNTNTERVVTIQTTAEDLIPTPTPLPTLAPPEPTPAPTLPAEISPAPEASVGANIQ